MRFPRVIFAVGLQLAFALGCFIDSGERQDTAEECNGKDDDSDGEVDEAPIRGRYRDGDGDGWGGKGLTCDDVAAGVGDAYDDGDCVDSDSSIHPHAQEACNGIDDDCDGRVDEDYAGQPYFRDEDGDGYGADELSCSEVGAGAPNSQEGGDCDDSDPAVNPIAIDICNCIDDDCDGFVDENHDDCECGGSDTAGSDTGVSAQ